MRISIVCGTRPEVVKLAPILLQLRDHPTLSAHLCVTGQHTSLLNGMLQFFQLEPDVHFPWKEPHRSLPELTARLSNALDQYFRETTPALVMVQGDTASTFVAALTAFHHQIPVAHVEAGLRTGSLLAPFPEEGYRQLTSRLASLHFAATERNREHLLAEGIPAKDIHVTGNTVVDALQWARALRTPPALPDEWASLCASGAPLVVVTCHRRESWGRGIETVGRSLRRLAEAFPEVHFLLPLHPNPIVKEPLRALLMEGASLTNVHLGEPVAYSGMLALLDSAVFVMTDSGGIQEEAAALKTPALVLREQTDRPEAVEAGLAQLVGLSEEAIVAAGSALLHSGAERGTVSERPNPFGDGRAARRIVAVCESFLSG